MKKLIISVLFLIFLLASCAHVSQFGDKDPYLSYLGKDGDFVFTSEISIDDFEKFNVSINRISGSFNPLTNIVSGALEGSFSRSKVKIALNYSNQFKKSGKDVWLDESSGIQVMVPANGIIIFSNNDVKNLYEDTFLKKEVLIKNDISYLLIQSDSGLYVKNPLAIPDFGFDLSQEAVESFDYILGSVNNDIADFTFSMKSEKFAQSLLKILKTLVLSEVRKAGQKVNTQELNSIVFADGNTVYFKERKIENNITENIINTFTGVI